MTTENSRQIPASRWLVTPSVLLSLCASMAYGQQQSVPDAVTLDSEDGEVPRYTVEIIVFEYAGSAAGTTEIFAPDAPDAPLPDEASLANRPGTAPAGPPAIGPAADDGSGSSTAGPADEDLAQVPTNGSGGLQLADPEDYQLKNTYRKLAELDAYRPLMHTAWTQPVVEKDETLPIKLRRIGNPPLQLDGTVSLYLSRYLHLVIDLSLEEKSPQRMTASEERLRLYGDNRTRDVYGFDRELISPPVFYRIQEDRIVRNNELRYFDHPKFGVLARITKVEQLAPEAIDTTGDLLPAGVN